MQHRHHPGGVPRIGLVLVVATTIVGCQSAASPSATLSSSSILPPSPTQAAPPTPTPAPPIFTSWAPLTLPEPRPHVFGGSSVAAAVAFQGGYLAVGGVHGGCCTGGFTHDTHGVVWRSGDGLAWDLDPTDPVFDLAALQGLATDGRRLVAIGALMLDSTEYPGDADPHGAAWVSDDGRTWELVEDLPLFETIVAIDGAFAALPFPDAGAEIWRSVDGRTWTRTSTWQELGPGVIRDMIPAPVGVVAVGSADDASGSTTGVSWLSVDGTHWRRAPNQVSLLGVSLAQVVVSGSVLVALGRGPMADVLAWSEDGLTWTRVIEQPLADGFSLEAVFGSARGFVVSGSHEVGDESVPFVWTSAGGRTWVAVDAPADAGPGELVALDRGGSLTVFGERLDQAVERRVPTAWDVR